ncbi:hypothetical protein NQ317_001364 [Molorchus minor]|uniref:Uncharacterized protein n=1 Tax=Molorchus minor TaxID=1323400 RepID=A0ABQ9J8H6_9CUCU|nr:hypothetical protein NQ317_001364 [Molorchus minor]
MNFRIPKLYRLSGAETPGRIPIQPLHCVNLSATCKTVTVSSFICSKGIIFQLVSLDEKCYSEVLGTYIIIKMGEDGVYTGYFLLDLLVVVTALVAVGYACFKWSYQYWKNKNVPYIEPSIPFGTNSNPFKSQYRLRHVGTYNMIQAVYVPVDLELIKHIMTKDSNAHLFAIGGKRRNLKVKLTPTFTSEKLKAMFQTLVDCGLTMENYIQENITDKDPVDIKELLETFIANKY